MKVKVVLTAIAVFLTVSGHSDAQEVRSEKTRPTVGLVLSGGGGRGFSHIGVIKALEENGIPIDYICGTSMGAIIGGYYAMGYSPDQMLEAFRSKEFAAWSTGKPERPIAKYFYNDIPTPSLFSFGIGKDLRRPTDTLEKWRVVVPASYISPYSMDLAVLELFAPSAKAARFDFDSLMVPFFCVAADVSCRKQVIMREGNLGSAIRASMTVPGAFKPIIIDSCLLFDGGLFNNFPWEEMRDFYHPDFIIGVKCVPGNTQMREDDTFSLLNGLIVSNTNYDIPDSLGILISNDYREFSTMDFGNADAVSQRGYEVVQPYIEKIKERISSRRSADEVNARRKEFRAKVNDKMRFSQEITVEGNLSKDAKRFVDRTIREDKRENFSLDQLKTGYSRVIESGVVNTFYPYYAYKESDTLFKKPVGHYNFGDTDSLFFLKIRATKAAPFRLYIGGNISSSSLNQAYIGGSYLHAGMNPWRMNLDFHLGKFYRGGGYTFRHDIGVKPLAYYFAEIVGHQFDYYNGNQNMLREDKQANNFQFKEFFLRGGIATPISLRKNLLAEFVFSVGRNYQRSYLANIVSTIDKPDKGSAFFFSPRLNIRKSSLDNLMYPTSGGKGLVSVSYTFMNEEYAPGTTNFSAVKVNSKRHALYSARLKGEKYFGVNKHLAIGIGGDLKISDKVNMSNYYSQMLVVSAYEPIPHASTLLLEHYRSYSYLGGSISPVIKFRPSIYIHTTAAYFQPYRAIRRGPEGWDYTFSKKLPRGAFIANVALVWQTPIGPLSLSTAYYNKGEYKWYPQLNFGLLIFKKKALED